MLHRPAFADRHDAGRKLAAAVRRERLRDPLVLALPRGGVPVAYEVAHALHADLDLLVVRKLGAPGYEELGIGAVVDGDDPQLLLNEDVVRQLAPSPDYIRHEMQRQLKEIERRRKAYLGERSPIPIRGRDVVLVDDGIATGGTIRAALRGVRKAGAARLILAVPVAPADTLAELRGQADAVICLETPYPFHAVGAHYADFTQTSDDEVVALMDRAAAERRDAVAED
ncbi:phosphoribosyltransferase [Sphingomonadaceae bacterium LXI357]|uniref:Phosphoribosyltransferase n=2 Tax=Stakelama marina TaxID=2826939 RepID=A0A8T4I9J2_9SPHN|nr:phosphoribosyltransferase [Stakelama marina]